MPVAVKQAIAKDDLKAERQALWQAQMKQLFDDVITAGCDFVIDGNELRLQNMARMDSALWARFEHFGGSPEFMTLSRQHAEAKMAARSFAT